LWKRWGLLNRRGILSLLSLLLRSLRLLRLRGLRLRGSLRLRLRFLRLRLRFRFNFGFWLGLDCGFRFWILGRWFLNRIGFRFAFG
jgi:hypothetical protein